MELTQEHFDQQLKKLVTMDALHAALASQTADLNDYADQQTEALARIVATTVADPMEKHFADLKDLLRIKETVELHGREIERLKGLLHAA